MTASRGRSGPSLLRNPDFLKLWTGQTISAVGTQVTLLAIPVLAALSLSVTPLEFALLGTIEFLPFVIVSLPAGVWVDRVRRRPILIGADLGRAAALLSIPLAAALDALTIWQLYVVVAVIGSLSASFDVAYQSYLPSIVAPDQLVDGNAKLELTRSSAQRLGPGLAGVLIAVLTAPVAVVVDAASYVASAVCLGWIRRSEPPVVATEGEDAARPSIRREILVGLRHVAGHPVLRPLALCIALGYLTGTIADSILILHLVTERGMGAELIGLAFTLGTAGVIAGSLVASRLTARLGVGPVIVGAAIGESVAWLPVAFAPDPLLLAGLATTITSLSFFGVLWNVNAVSLRQAITPERLRGRTTATMRFISWLTIPVGATAGGALGGVIGLHATIVVGAVAGLVTFLPVAFSPVTRIRSMPTSPDGLPAIGATADTMASSD